MKKENLFVILTGVVIGIAALVLTALGNPANMGFCIACFERDIAGAVGLHSAAKVQYVRPEIIGLVLGSFLTAILPGAAGLAENLIPDEGTLGVRIPDHEFCRRMLRALGRPIVSTSANISGEATPVGLQDVAREIIDGVDFVVNPRFEGKPTRKASSIIAFGEGGEVKIIRE